MLRFMKVPPTTYVLHYKYGKIKREGAGLSFFYYGPTSTIDLLGRSMAFPNSGLQINVPTFVEMIGRKL